MKQKQSIKLVIIIIIFVISGSCTYKHITKALSPMEKTKVTIIGVAHNSKAGAMILTENKEVFYIAGLDEWNNKFYEKKVKVRGQVSIENFKEEDLQNEKGEWVQGMIGEKRTILEAEWELVK